MVRDEIVKSLREVTTEEDVLLEFPENEAHGDYASNVALVIAKKMDRNPREYAGELVKKLSQVDSLMQYVAKVEVAGPGFINFWVKEELLLDEVREITRKGSKYGRSDHGRGKTVVIDYSSPNIAKTFGVGHLRSTLIGQALYNLYEFLGYRVIGDNHLGDWGTQFGKLLYMVDRAGKSARLTVNWLERSYVEFHNLSEEDPSLEEEARKWFKRLEEGDPRARDIWKKCVEVSVREFKRIYELLGIEIDYAYGESFYENMMPSVISEAKEKGIARESDGAWIIDIPGVEAPLILVKSDGATTYATRDLATLKFRKETFNPDLVIYEVGVEQSLHFAQVFAASRMLGYIKEGGELVHTKHGLYLGKDGRKLSTRHGLKTKLEDVLQEAMKRARELGSKDDATARAVGIGAIKYYDLKHSPQSNIVFDWEKIFELQGNSGPYLQYTFARTQSVLAKSKGTDSNPKLVEANAEELAILRHLHRFSGIIVNAARNYSANTLCEYLYQLAQKYNTFYNRHRIIGSRNEEFRLLLTRAVGQILQNGLGLLGITAVERM